MRLNREALLHTLEAVSPGLATRQEVVEQSSCFVFKDGYVITFNDEVMCLYKSPVDFEGAVPAAELSAILSKMPDEDIEIGIEEAFCVVRGKGRRRAKIGMEAQILLPFQKVDVAETWQPLSEHFSEAVATVQEVSSKNDRRFVCACIRICPTYMEALDNLQMVRYTVPTPLREPTLVRTNALMHVPALGMTEIAETRAFVHFRNPAGLIVRCRRYAEEFPNMDSLLNFEAARITLPGGLAASIPLAEVFSAENKDNNNILVRLRPGAMYICGQGTKGKFEEEKPAVYDGPPLAFVIAAKILTGLTKRQNECEVGEKFLKIRGSRFVYITCLGVAEGAEAKKQTA